MTDVPGVHTSTGKGHLPVFLFPKYASDAHRLIFSRLNPAHTSSHNPFTEYETIVGEGGVRLSAGQKQVF